MLGLTGTRARQPWLYPETRHMNLSVLLKPGPVIVGPINWINTTRQNHNNFATNGVCRTPLQTDKSGTRPFWRWIEAQGCSLDTTRIPKNYSGPVGISLKKGYCRRQSSKIVWAASIDEHIQRHNKPGHIRAVDTTAGRNVSYLLDCYNRAKQQ